MDGMASERERMVGRETIASGLMLKEGLTEEPAYFAADQILRVALEKTESR